MSEREKELNEEIASLRHALHLHERAETRRKDWLEHAVIDAINNCATIADSFSRDYGPEVGKMASRIAEVIRRQKFRVRRTPPPTGSETENGPR